MPDPSSPKSKLEELGAPPPHSVRLILAVTATRTVSLMSYYARAQLLTPIMDEFGRGEEAVG